MNHFDDDLSPEERDMIARLPREATPPPALEDATVTALHTRGLLHRAAVLRRSRRWAAGLGALAAAALLFAGGLAVGRGYKGPRAPIESGLTFVLFLYEGAQYLDPAPGQETERVREYATWARAGHAGARVLGGEKLRDAGGTLVGIEGGRLTGYFLVRAPDESAAVEVARRSPHVRYRGGILVREIEPT